MTRGLFLIAHRVAEAMLETLIHYPYGYTFIAHLPRSGRRNKRSLKARLARQVLTETYPPMVIHVLLSAALLPSGAPNPSALHLYHWLLRKVYSDNTQAMYKEWLQMPQHLKKE